MFKVHFWVYVKFQFQRRQHKRPVWVGIRFQQVVLLWLSIDTAFDKPPQVRIHTPEHVYLNIFSPIRQENLILLNQSVNGSVYGTSYNMGSKVTFTQLLLSHKHPTGHIQRPTSGKSLSESHKHQTRYQQLESLNYRDIIIRQNNAWCKR